MFLILPSNADLIHQITPTFPSIQFPNNQTHLPTLILSQKITASAQRSNNNIEIYKVYCFHLDQIYSPTTIIGIFTMLSDCYIYMKKSQSYMTHCLGHTVKGYHKDSLLLFLQNFAKVLSF